MNPRLAVAGTVAFALALAAVAMVLRQQSATSYDWSRLDVALQRMMDENALTGASMIVIRGEDRIYEHALGDFDLDTWVTTGSASKWASAAAILSLVDDGTLQMTSTMGEHVPSWAGTPKASTTLEMALSHRAGLHAKHDCLRAYDRPLQECVDQIALSPSLYAPGDGFGYGALSFHAAAAMAEKATGKSFREVVEERLTTPLGMKSTRFGKGGHSPNPGVAGNLVSSSNDFANFLQMVLNYGMFNGTRVISEESIRAMEGPHAGPGPYFHHIPERHASSRHDIYGLGVWRDVVAPDGSLLVMSAPGKFGFTPWIDRRVNVAAVITPEWSHQQLNYGKPPDPADVMYVVCDIVYRHDHPDAPTPNPFCRRRGVSEAHDDGARRKTTIIDEGDEE